MLLLLHSHTWILFPPKNIRNKDTDRLFLTHTARMLLYIARTYLPNLICNNTNKALTRLVLPNLNDLELFRPHSFYWKGLANT